MARDRRPKAPPKAASTTSTAATAAVKSESRPKKREQEDDDNFSISTPIPKKKSRTKAPVDSEEEEEIEFDDENSVVPIDKPPKKKGDSSKTAALKKDESDEEEDDDEVEDDCPIFEDKTLALSNYLPRHRTKVNNFMNENVTASAAIALANAIDENVWFPLGQTTPGADLYGFSLIAQANKVPLKEDETLAMAMNNRITSLIKPLYNFQKIEEAKFNLSDYSIPTPVVVVFPSKGDAKYKGFAVCGSWIYVAKEKYTMEATQQNFLNLGYMEIVNEKGDRVRHKHSRSKLEETTRRLEQAVTSLENSVLDINTAHLESSIKTEDTTRRLEEAVAGLVSSTSSILEKLEQGTNKPSGSSEATLAESPDSKGKVGPPPEAEGPEQTDEDMIPTIPSPAPEAEAKPTPPKPTVINISRGEVVLQKGQMLRVRKGIRHFAIVPNKDYVTKLLQKEEQRRREMANAALNPNSHHVHASRR